MIIRLFLKLGIWIVLTMLSLYDGAASNNVIQGNTASIPCYNPQVASSFSNDVLVKIQFKTDETAPTLLVAHYKPSSGRPPVVFANSYNTRLVFTSTGQLEIKFVGLRDEGIYECVVEIYSQLPTSLTTPLVVFVAPEYEVKKVNNPLVVGNPGMIVNAATCEARSGKPQADVSWGTIRHLDFDQTLTNSSTSPQLTTTISTLHIEPTKFYNKQSFYCEISHPALPATVRQTIFLNVTYSPETPVITVSEDGSSLTCAVDANPPATISWQLPPSAPSATFNGPTVVMASPNTPENSNDTYICIATNGVGQPARNSITAKKASNIIIITKESNVGVIIGAVIGSLVFLALIIAVVYFFLIRPSREKDTGPYEQTISPFKPDDGSRQSSVRMGSTHRPLIEHANESLNKNRPPSPNQPPPDDAHESGSSDSDSSEGNHDVDLEVDPTTNLVDPKYDDTTGITSKASVSFQPYWRNSISEARRKRPSTSPASRRSRIEHRQGDSPSPAPRQTQPRYDFPPSEDYEGNEPHDENPPLQYEDRQRYPSEEFSDPYPHQPAYVGYPPEVHRPPRRTDSLPQYEPKYSEIDHSNYKQPTGQRRQQYEEPVEYAQIRHGYSHVV